jgi:hypothetical protein
MPIMTNSIPGGEEAIATIRDAAGTILAVSEDRAWIENFFDFDLMHTKIVNLPTGATFDFYVKEIPHKTTVYEHPRAMIFFNAPCDLDIGREGHRVIVRGGPPQQSEKLL